MVSGEEKVVEKTHEMMWLMAEREAHGMTRA